MQQFFLVKSVPHVEKQDSSLEVVLDHENGYYLIGQECNECKVFVLSVSIGGAKNLIKVVFFSFIQLFFSYLNGFIFLHP